VIAVSAPSADKADIRAFVEEKYGDAPVTVYTGTTGETFLNVGAGTFPSAVFLDADGRRTDPPADWPGST
jgi:hypothetical protein